MSDLGAIFHVKKAGVQYDAHAYTTIDECPEPNLKLMFNGQQAYVKLVSKGSGDVPCYVKTKGGAIFQVLASHVKPQENFFVAKGQTPWYNNSWGGRNHVTNIDESISGQAIVTCDANVTNTDEMFYKCTNLTELDLSHFDTSKVTSMHSMFANCFSLKSLDVTKFDTSRVTKMYSMFEYSKIPVLNLSSFNTSSVTTMSYMFKGANCVELNLSNFNTSNVAHMYMMFYGCANLATIIGTIDMKSCTDWHYMFYDCHKLTGVKIKNPPSGFDGAGLNSSQYTIVQ